MGVIQTREKRIKELKGIARDASEDPEIIRAVVTGEAIRKYGVSKKTARSYTEAVLYQLGHIEKWWDHLIKPEVEKDAGSD